MPEQQYHLAELEIALDPARPEHILPELSSARVGVVDVGCGIGQLFVAKGDEVPRGVPCYGFDIDPNAIRYANDNWPGKATFAVAPAESLPLPDASVDIYVARVTLQVADIRRALQEAARVLVPGGRLWITMHPVSMILGELGHSISHGRARDAIRRVIALGNGVAFHLTGTGHRFLGIRDAWQSESRMRRELARDFAQVRVTRERHFLIEATRR